MRSALFAAAVAAFALLSSTGCQSLQQNNSTLLLQSPDCATADGCDGSCGDAACGCNDNSGKCACGGLFGRAGLCGHCGACGSCGKGLLGRSGLLLGRGCNNCRGGSGLARGFPHTDPYAQGYPGGQPGGQMTPSYGYPYYTTRGPRDFLSANPASIGR